MQSFELYNVVDLSRIETGFVSANQDGILIRDLCCNELCSHITSQYLQEVPSPCSVPCQKSCFEKKNVFSKI